MKKSYLVLIVVIVFGLIGCTNTKIVAETEKKPVISRYPSVANFKDLNGKIETLPQYNASSSELWQIDVRSADLSSLDLHDRTADLLHADFDSETLWPDNLPEGFDPTHVMDLGKDPGLSTRTLHEQGITGKGVSIAIIDQSLLIDHQEYKNQLKFYEEINIRSNESASMHGAAVASIAVGKTVGVAPDAELYYIAETHGTNNNGDFEWDFSYLAKSIDKILEVNKDLPDDNKIRVISISVGWSSKQKGYEEVTAAVARAKEEGIFVISSSLYETDGYELMGLGRDSLSDPNIANSYKPGEFWANRFYNSGNNFGISGLLVPMDSRATASPTGQEDYVFYSRGGLSWSIPYVAGLYALACQVDPEITPNEFWRVALTTGTIIELEHNEKKFKLGKIVDPIKMMESLKSK